MHKVVLESWDKEISLPQGIRTTFKSNLTCKFLSIRLILLFTFHYEIPCVKFLASQTFFNFGIGGDFVNMSFIWMIFPIFQWCQKVPVLKEKNSKFLLAIKSQKILQKNKQIFFSISALAYIKWLNKKMEANKHNVIDSTRLKEFNIGFNISVMSQYLV